MERLRFKSYIHWPATMSLGVTCIWHWLLDYCDITYVLACVSLSSFHVYFQICVRARGAERQIAKAILYERANVGHARRPHYGVLRSKSHCPYEVIHWCVAHIVFSRVKETKRFLLFWCKLAAN